MSLCCGGGAPDDAVERSLEEQKADKELKEMQREAEKQEMRIIKMLLLGAGESGKSTIFKQMKVINKNGYSEKERADFTNVVHMNVCQSMRSLLAAFDKLGESTPVDIADDIKLFEDLMSELNEKLNPQIGELVAKLWAHDSIQRLFKRRNEFQLHAADSAEFYFTEVARLSADGYLPTTDDILRSRVRTTGIVQSDFVIKGLNFSMFDVGGQRNERRKWIHCFDNVNAVVFVASLSEFDQTLFEDESKNRLDEAQELFQQISNSKWFADTSLILFLNKKDLFEKKLQEKVFKDYVKTYDGPNEVKPCAEHVKQLMVDRCKNKDKSIFTHITTAIDTSNVKFVFNAVVAMILEENLKATGLA